MEFSLGYIKSGQQFVVRSFGPESDDLSKVVDLSDFEGQAVDALFLGQNGQEEMRAHESWPKIEASRKFCPVREAKEIGLGAEDFENMSAENARKLWEKVNAPWVLANNLSLLDNLFATLTHMNQFWPNQRSNFFEELWHILKINLGATELTLIYNDLKKAQSENEKNKLIQVRIPGERTPSPTEGGEAEKALVKHYEKDLGQPRFHVIEWDKAKGQLTFCFSIYQGPVLALAKTSNFGPLQNSLLTALIDGLNHDKTIH